MVLITDEIFTETIALYQAGNQSAKPWASIAVGDYLQWVKSGTAPFKYKTYGERWKLKTPLNIMSGSATTIKLLREGVADAEKKALKKERLTGATFSHCNPTGKSGVVLERKETVKVDRGTHLVSFDIDAIDTIEQAQAERDRLFKEIPYVLSSSLSASGKGVWLLVTLSRKPVGREEFANIWWMLAVELQEKYNVTIGGTDGKGSTDTAPSNMVSLRFYTYDPEIWIREATMVERYELPDAVPDKKDSQIKAGVVQPTIAKPKQPSPRQKQTLPSPRQKQTLPSPLPFNQPPFAVERRVPSYAKRVEWVAQAPGNVFGDGHYLRMRDAVWQDVVEGHIPKDGRISAYTTAVGDKHSREDVIRAVKGAITKVNANTNQNYQTEEITAEDTTNVEEEKPVALDRSYIGAKKPLSLASDIVLANHGEDDEIRASVFVPARGRINLLCGKDNVGKSAWLLEIAGHLTRADYKVLYVASDAYAKDVSPFLEGLEIKHENFHIESTKSAIFLVDHLAHLITLFEKELGNKPDLIIFDSLVDFVIETAQSFMPKNDRNQIQGFNEYRAADWKIAFSRFINPLANFYDCAIIGSVHSTPKGELGEHEVALSHRLPGLVDDTFMVFDNTVRAKGAQNKALIATLRACDSNTRLLFNRRVRSGSKKTHYFYDLGDSVEGASLGQDNVRKIVNLRVAVATRHPASRKELDTTDAIIDKIYEKAGGKVEVKLNESVVLRTLNCDPKTRERSATADKRFDLYQKAKQTEFIDLESSYKGVKIWVTQAYVDRLKKAEAQKLAHKSRGYQDC